MAVVINGTTGITDADGGQVLSDADYTTITAALTPSITTISATDRDNKIINGDFGVWQRATTVTGPGYAADRWYNNRVVGGTVIQSKVDYAVGSTLGGSSVTSILRQTVSGQTLATQGALTQQFIESVRSYAGQTITVLGWAMCSSGVGNMVIEGEQRFGTGGTPSANVTGINPTTVTLTNSMQPFAVVLNIPSIIGKTIGTTNNDALQLNFWTSAGSDYNARTNSLGLQTIGVDLWGIHIRQGTWTAAHVDLYRPRDLGTEFALCQRYYETGVGTLIASYTGGNFGGGLSRVFFNVRKRIIPTVTVTRNSGVGTIITFSVGNDAATGCGVWFNGNATVGDYMNYTYFADAEL